MTGARMQSSSFVYRALVATFNVAGPHGEFEKQGQNERP